ncbi:twin-arginine translocase TatA/TatE family subunit [Dysgonomonas sp.]|uniref:twin-arginine translocase TatA/TatE family subunit n=1 Tax=Dysgonomonas sp. TaxID=1891233 RepID=UPI002D1FA769|nr:twin-arginine translocase TatA/TatE family subunit [Dysgonomonas sp.]
MNTLLFLGNLGTGEILILLPILIIAFLALPIWAISKIHIQKQKIKMLEERIEELKNSQMR